MSRGFKSERLARRNWIDALKALGRDSQLASKREADDLVRRLHAVLSIAPIELAEIFPVQCDEEALDRILEVGATESAARRVLEGKINYLLSHPIRHDAIATVSIPGYLDHEQTAAGSCETNAFVAALSFALANAGTRLNPANDRSFVVN